MPSHATDAEELGAWCVETVMERAGVGASTATATAGCLTRAGTKRDASTANTQKMDMANKWVVIFTFRKHFLNSFLFVHNRTVTSATPRGRSTAKLVKDTDRFGATFNYQSRGRSDFDTNLRVTESNPILSHFDFRFTLQNTL